MQLINIKVKKARFQLQIMESILILPQTSIFSDIKMGVTAPPPPPPPPSLLSTPFSSPNVAALLKIKILSWSQETGFPVCIRVRIADRTFNLHKLPLISKSGYFREKLKESNEIDLPPNFPGGPETLEMIALFIYGSSTLVDPLNVAPLRCAAEFLRMTEEYGGTGNLCERFDIYLNQVVLQSWNDTLIVLQKCQALLPWAEDLLIVSRCIETLAFMACMEILDPERRRGQAVVTLEALCRRPCWGDDTVRNIDLWIMDLIALPLVFFKRVVGSLRRQGMKEKYIGPIVLFYAHKWVISRRNNDENDGYSCAMVEGVIDLLPNASSKLVVPVGFYFALLAASIELGARDDSVEKLQKQIGSLLHLARVQDLLLPKDGIGLCVMETIFSIFYKDSECSSSSSCVVAELWDVYLNQIADDAELSCERFINLIETVPIWSRQTHDHLYRALNTFFKRHPNISEEEKGAVVRVVKCEKLSQQACIEAVQNDAMPLRLIVQALLVQQLHTQQALRDSSSSSFNSAAAGEFSSSAGGSSSIWSPYMMNAAAGGEIISRKDYESTSFKIQNLEKEVTSLRMTLQDQKKMEEPPPRRRRRSSNKNMKSPLGRVGGSCIGTVNFASQRKYATRILRMLQRVALFGRSRGKPAAP